MKNMIAETTRLETCPECGSALTTVWAQGRKLVQTCRQHRIACTWKGEPFAPKKKAIRKVKLIPACNNGGWVYEAFDQYGHAFAFSQTFASRKDCVAAAKDAITRQDPAYGTCVAVVWPPMTTVRGDLVRPTKRKTR